MLNSAKKAHPRIAGSRKNAKCASDFRSLGLWSALEWAQRARLNALSDFVAQFTPCGPVHGQQRSSSAIEQDRKWRWLGRHAGEGILGRQSWTFRLVALAKLQCQACVTVLGCIKGVHVCWLADPWPRPAPLLVLCPWAQLGAPSSNDGKVHEAKSVPLVLIMPVSAQLMMILRYTHNCLVVRAGCFVECVRCRRSVQVVLLNHIDELGFQGQEVSVKSGYARNYLIPTKLAVYANDTTRKAFKANMTVRAPLACCIVAATSIRPMLLPACWRQILHPVTFIACVQAEAEAEAGKLRERNLLRKRLQAIPLRFAVATVDDTKLYGSVE
jgi:ribosomal protein L9